MDGSLNCISIYLMVDYNHWLHFLLWGLVTVGPILQSSKKQDWFIIFTGVLCCKKSGFNVSTFQHFSNCNVLHVSV